MSTLFVPQGKMLQSLTREFWRRFDNPTQASEIFARVRSIMVQLRFGRSYHEYETPLTDDEAFDDLRSKLQDFAESYGKVKENEMVAKYQIIPRAEGVTCEVFGWFVQQGEEGRRFFEGKRYQPDSFVSQADIEFARRLSQEGLWDDTRTVYRNHEFS